MATTQRPGKQVLTPADVAAMYGVDAKTVTRWANKGRLPYFKSPGGHRRFYRADVERLFPVTATVNGHRS